MKSNKFVLDWQVDRVEAKNTKSFDKKVKIIKAYVLNNKTVESHDRALNWANSFLGRYSKIEEIKNFKLFLNELKYKSNEGEIINDFNSYNDKIKIKVLKDLLLRNKKWLVKGYRHENQNKFIVELFKSFKDNKIIDLLYKKYKEEYEGSFNIVNSHKFLF